MKVDTGLVNALSYKIQILSTWEKRIWKGKKKRQLTLKVYAYGIVFALSEETNFLVVPVIFRFPPMEIFSPYLV